MKAVLSKQNGVTFGGFIMIAILFVTVAIMSMKLIPAYMENGKIQKALESIVRDPDMQVATVAEIKNSFIKRANIMDNVTTLNADDLTISRENGVLTLSAAYNVKVPLAGNVSLLIEFSPSAHK